MQYFYHGNISDWDNLSITRLDKFIDKMLAEHNKENEDFNTPVSIEEARGFLYHYGA